jgi:hypothetical protein
LFLNPFFPWGSTRLMFNSAGSISDSSPAARICANSAGKQGCAADEDAIAGRCVGGPNGFSAGGGEHVQRLRFAERLFLGVGPALGKQKTQFPGVSNAACSAQHGRLFFWRSFGVDYGRDIGQRWLSSQRCRGCSFLGTIRANAPQVECKDHRLLVYT